MYASLIVKNVNRIKSGNNSKRRCKCKNKKKKDKREKTNMIGIMQNIVAKMVNM